MTSEFDIKNKENDQPKCVYSKKYDSWLRSFNLITPSENVILKDRFLHHGYRPNSSSFTYCLRSAFYPTNETLNFWTHFIPFVYLLFRGYSTFSSLENPYNALYYPYWVLIIAFSILLLTSSLAHLFHCYSPEAPDFCFCCDYSAVTVASQAIAVAALYYIAPVSCCTNQISTTGFLLSMLCFGTVNLCVISISRFPNQKDTKVIKVLPFILMLVFGSFFIVMRSMSLCNESGTKCSFFIPTFWDLFIFGFGIFVACLVFVVQFPERFYPGYFDIFGHSHQVFHVVVAALLIRYVSTNEEIITKLSVLHKNGNVSSELLEITWMSTFGFLIINISIGIFIVYNVLNMLKKGKVKDKNI